MPWRDIIFTADGCVFPPSWTATNPVRHGQALITDEERVLLDLLAQTETPFQAHPQSQADATGEANGVAPRRANADRPHDDARLARFEEPLNGTNGRQNRVYRTTPPPPINRHQSTSQIFAAAPTRDDIHGSARLNRFREPLNDTNRRPNRVYRTTPLPPIQRRQSTSLIFAAAPSHDGVCGSARLNRFEDLNDTNRRPNRVYRTTPLPPINRHQSTSQILATAPPQDDVRGSARFNRFEVLNDTTGRPKRVCRKTPPPSRSEKATLDFPELCTSHSGSPTEDEALADYGDRLSRASTLGRDDFERDTSLIRNSPPP